MKAQQEQIEKAKEEAAEKDAKQLQDGADRVNVLDVKVEENFNIEDI